MYYNFPHIQISLVPKVGRSLVAQSSGTIHDGNDAGRGTLGHCGRVSHLFQPQFDLLKTALDLSTIPSPSRFEARGRL